MESIYQRTDIIQIAGGLGLALLLALISYRTRLVTISGALGMILIGIVVFGLGGLVFSIPLLFFFFTSSLLTVIKNPAKRRSQKVIDKAGPRDLGQVLANGGAAAIFVIVYFVSGRYIWFFAYLACVCEAAADTWATEIGTLSKTYPVSITTLKKVEPGISGGISVLGTLAALLGAILTMLSALPAAAHNSGLLIFAFSSWFIAANGGFAGAIFDSLLGASLQAQYRCLVCDRLTERREHCGLPSKYLRGYRFINNDTVNFFSALFAALMALLPYLF